MPEWPTRRGPHNKVSFVCSAGIAEKSIEIKQQGRDPKGDIFEAFL